MTIEEQRRSYERLRAYSRRDEQIRRNRPPGWDLDDPRLQPQLEQARRDADAEYKSLVRDGHGPAVEPEKETKMKWLSALASYVRVVATVTLTLVYQMGHIPATPEEWRSLGTGALFSLLPVILRWLNPQDPAYGRGAK